jgi:hypothetical protein
MGRIGPSFCDVFNPDSDGSSLGRALAVNSPVVFGICTFDCPPIYSLFGVGLVPRSIPYPLGLLDESQ